MPDVIYIGGWGRSGSTALEAELQQYDDVCGLGELRYLWDRGWIRDERCACGQRFSSCVFWQDVIARVRERRSLQPRHLGRLQRSMSTLPQLARRSSRDTGRALISEYVDALDAVIVAAAEASGASVLVDSSKQAAPLALLSLCPSVTLHVVHLVREPVGVARSWATTKQRPESNGEHPVMAQSGPVKSALLWMTHNYGVEMLEPSLGATTHVRQSDLLEAPRDEARRVFDRLGLDPGTPDPASRWHSVAGNPDRLATATTTPRPDAPPRTAGDRMVHAITTPGRHRWLR